jgi:putative FmdB family regulatory protein
LHEFEELQKFSDEALTVCPVCHKNTLVRMIGAGGGLVFKGSGFYSTDYKKSSSSPAPDKKSTSKEQKKDEAAGPKKDHSAEQKADQKAEQKQEPKSDSKPSGSSEKKSGGDSGPPTA